MLHQKRQQLDTEKWDACINNSEDGKPYLYSWWLDIVCPEWEFLADSDYSAIFPLPVKRKLGFKANLQPPFVQQVHCIGPNAGSKNNELHCAKFIKKNYRIFDIQVSETMATHFAVAGIKLRSNYVWDKSASEYTTNHKRNLKKAHGHNLVIDFNTPPDNFINFFERTTALLDKSFNKKTLQIFRTLIDESLSKKCGMICSAYKGNEMVASAFMVKSNQYLCYTAGGSNLNGKESSAMYLIIDAMIKLCRKENLKLDFEGSDIKGVAHFFEGFGAKKENYFRITRKPILLK